MGSRQNKASVDWIIKSWRKGPASCYVILKPVYVREFLPSGVCICVAGCVCFDQLVQS